MSWSVAAGLTGRGVIVTGAAGGIGSAVTKAFAEAGARVAAVDLDAGRVKAMLGECAGTGHTAIGTDLADVTRHEGLIRRVREELGEVYTLAHTAAMLIRRPDTAAISETDWDTQVGTNLKATFFLCRAAATAMVEQGTGGRIITLASQGWWTGGTAGAAPYAASKAGVVSVSRNLARAYGPHGVTVNSVAPGQIRTPLLFTGNDPAAIEAMRQVSGPLGQAAAAGGEEAPDFAGFPVGLGAVVAAVDGCLDIVQVVGARKGREFAEERPPLGMGFAYRLEPAQNRGRHVI